MTGCEGDMVDRRGEERSGGKTYSGGGRKRLTRKGGKVEERVEEAEVNDGVVRRKTHTTTSVEVYFLFNNNLEQS